MALRRVSLLLLTLVAVLITAMPALAAGDAPAVAAPAAGAGRALNQCAAPNPALQAGTPEASLAAVISTGGYVLCSCQLCAGSDVVCRISPSGYSIRCADYYQAHCQG